MSVNIENNYTKEDHYIQMMKKFETIMLFQYCQVFTWWLPRKLTLKSDNLIFIFCDSLMSAYYYFKAIHKCQGMSSYSWKFCQRGFDTKNDSLMCTDITQHKGPPALLTIRQKVCSHFFFTWKKSQDPNQIEPVNLGSRGKHTNP